ncbi:C-type natriuretic peptide 2 [Oryzias melastigma]|uniref:C-type natriuretic peptide 2-like n=1 Tax=Oryzias melastigma TaxID=30732 RepID=A0A3B3D6E3_ORYME|nr:C-type natriuretic peptide 2 [Oryzias melastigma]
MAVCSSSSLVFLIIFLSVAVETRPSSDRDEEQVLKSLFGPHLSSLILAPPTSDEGSSGSLDPPTPSEAAVTMHGEAKVTAARILRSFLSQREKTRRWGRKTMVAGGGCFGMKMDRIGSISGLGC